MMVITEVIIVAMIIKEPNTNKGVSKPSPPPHKFSFTSQWADANKHHLMRKAKKRQTIDQIAHIKITTFAFKLIFFLLIYKFIITII
jgi:hypothetical protein